MRNMPLTMRVPPRVGGGSPLAVGRVLFSRNPAVLPRLADAVRAHRAQMQDNADWLGQRHR